MKRQAIGGLVLFGLSVLFVTTSVRAQNIPDTITVRDAKDGTNKSFNGTFTVSPAGFQVVAADKKVLITLSPDDVVKVAIGDLPGVDRSTILTANPKEEKRDFEGARTIYVDMLKKGNIPERSKRYLEFKKVTLTNKMIEDAEGKAWQEKADECIADWKGFLDAESTPAGWEQWPAVRACTRLQIERGKFDDAARTWTRVVKNANMPPEARLEASLQEVDLQIRAKAYAAASTTATELAKNAAGARKDRLNIYILAAKAGSDGKPLEGVDKIKAEMDKTKDPSVHATGFSMMGELYLAGGKPRDAMWMFLWVETVVNQDKDETLKAMTRLIEVFEAQMDEDQVKKYHDKIKRFRATF